MMKRLSFLLIALTLLTAGSINTWSQDANGELSTLVLTGQTSDDLDYRNAISQSEQATIGTADYTVKYIFNNEVVKIVEGSDAIGTTITAENPIIIKGVKYYAVDGSTLSMELVDGANVLEVTLRKEETRSTTAVGQILGEDIDLLEYFDYQTKFIEYYKMMSQYNQVNVEQLKQMAWHSIVQNKLTENEASKLGLTVTDEEVKSLMEKGSPLLSELAQSLGFVNEQTGMFDKAKYDAFLEDYDKNKSNTQATNYYYEMMYKFLEFKVEEFKQQLLMAKYNSLLQNAVLSNLVEAKFAFDAEKQESDIQLAYLDYNSINDIKISDDDLSAKYNELKEEFKIPEEARAIKFILVKKEASRADRDEQKNMMVKFADYLRDGKDPSIVIMKSQSELSHLGVPVTKKAFNPDIADKIDSMTPGEVLGPIESKMDNSFYVVKLFAKATLPDSVEFRCIPLLGDDFTTTTKADSIIKAINAGGDLEAIAKNYGATGQKTWLTSARYERVANISMDDALIINELNTMAVNEVKVIPQIQGKYIVQVTDRKAMTEKYDVAIVKREIRYSRATSDGITNKFNQFVAGHKTLEAMEKDADSAGYQVLEVKNITTSQGMIPGIPNSREALKWVFEADVNDVSEIFNCGENYDELLVMVLTRINPKGCMTLDNPEIEEFVKHEVVKDKKAELLIAQLKDVKSIKAAKAKGAKVLEGGVKQITFESPVCISELNACEYALSGAVAATAKGKFSSKPVKGDQAVYVFFVKDRRTLEGEFNAKEYMQKLMQVNSNIIRSVSGMDLYFNAGIKDNRYLFF